METPEPAPGVPHTAKPTSEDERKRKKIRRNEEKKRLRTNWRACQPCRLKRVKCHEGIGDSCKRCTEDGSQCVYSKQSRPRPPKSPSPPEGTSPPGSASPVADIWGSLQPVQPYLDESPYASGMFSTYASQEMHTQFMMGPPQSMFVELPEQLFWAPPYRYSSITTSQIRLLSLAAGKGNEPIRCTLKTIGMRHIERVGEGKASLYKYLALSYAWGTENPTKSIYVDMSETTPFSMMPPPSTPSACELKVRPNLHCALKNLRLESSDVWVWIDAICINQEDEIEKDHQIDKMPFIFGNAWSVIIWIGDDDSRHAKGEAMDFIPTIVNLSVLDRLVAPTASDQTLRRWVAFAALLKRAWFSRKWVIQEIAFANRAALRCGNKVISWHDFADAVELFFRKLDHIKALYDASELSKTDPDAITYVQSAGAQALLQASNGVLRKRTNGAILDRLWTLESLVIGFTSFETTDPRDTVYALLSLASDVDLSAGDDQRTQTKEKKLFRPQYHRNAQDTFIEFVKFCVESSNSLDVICRHWAPAIKDEAMPSWIGLVSDSPFGTPSRFTGRINGDSLVGRPESRAFNSSRGFTAQATFSLSNHSTDENPGPAMSISRGRYFQGILTAQGVIVRRIKRTSPRVVDGTISDECLDILGWQHRTTRDNVSEIPEQLWRTLVADRSPEGKNAPTWYKRACAYSLMMTSPEGDLNTSKLIERKTQPASVVEYLRRVQSVVWSRKFFETDILNDEQAAEGEDKSNLVGMGSRHIREGDLVCILFGCSVPVILRTLKDASSGPAVRVKLVGECFVYGKMDGEAFAGLKEVDVAMRTTTFEIV